MSRAPTESDPFFQLLSDALRAGPGSAQWGEAVAKLRDGGVDGADEYRLILRAREDLQQGRDFRRVTAGPGFTRKVLEAVEQEGGRQRNGVPTATIIAILAGLVILGILVAVVVRVGRNDGATNAGEVAIRRLDATSFPVAVSSATFDEGAQPVVQRWRVIGELPPDMTDGLKAGAPATAATGPTATPAATQQVTAKASGGAIVTPESLPADAPVQIEAELVLPPAGAGQPLTQLFVSDSADFAPASATTPREVVWTYRDGRASVDVAGREAPESQSIGKPGDTVKASIRLDRETAIVEAAGRRLYAGPHGLAPGAARYAGVRFIRAAGDGGASATVRSVSVSRAAAPAGAAPAGAQ